VRFRRRRPESGVVRGTHDDPSLSDEELLERRRQWFEAYTSQRNVYAAERGEPYTCPCCGHPTLSERGVYEICPECGWEDDGQDDHDSTVVRGGPNGGLSLDAARARYLASGGERGEHVPPTEPA
jgi:hypothetical protein